MRKRTSLSDTGLDSPTELVDQGAPAATSKGGGEQGGREIARIKAEWVSKRGSEKGQGQGRQG
jgi:hypothetical protein